MLLQTEYTMISVFVGMILNMMYRHKNYRGEKSPFNHKKKYIAAIIVATNRGFRTERGSDKPPNPKSSKECMCLCVTWSSCPGHDIVIKTS